MISFTVSSRMKVEHENVSPFSLTDLRWTAKGCQSMQTMPKLRLRELRQARGITQLKLAMDLNMSQNSISRYENGQREAGYVELVLFADYFNISIDHLLSRISHYGVS